MEFLDNAIGSMRLDYVSDTLIDFECTIDTNSSDEIINKLNAISKVYQLKNSELLDGLVAFTANTRKNTVSLEVLEDYERQVLSKQAQINSDSSRISNATLSDRAILREIPLVFSQNNNDEDDDEEDGCLLEDEFRAFDDNKHFKEIKRGSQSIDLLKNRRNINPSDVKSQWRGELFSPRNKTESDHISVSKTKLNLVSLSVDYEFRFGMEDCEELLPNEEFEENLPEEQRGVTVLSGVVFPMDDRTLNAENAYLFTRLRAFHLDFEKIDRLAIFSGKKMTLSGLLNGDTFSVQHIVAPKNTVFTSLQLNQDVMSRTGHLKIMIACGPFALNSCTEFGIFDRLMSQVVEQSVNVLILIGPLLPKGWNVPVMSFQKVFSEYHEKLLNLRRNFPCLRIVFIPSCHDLCATQYFPTPPYSSTKTINSDVDFLPDPAVFELEGIRFSVTASEILAHLSKNEVYKSGDMENEDRMSRLITHIFESRSLYPLYPSDVTLPFNLTSETYESLKLSNIPHVFIAPSYLQPMVKIVAGSIVINPGRLTRGDKMGTYATISIDLESIAASNPDEQQSSIAPYSEVQLLAAIWKDLE